MKEEAESEGRREAIYIREPKEVAGIYRRKGGAWALTLVLLFTAFITMSVFAPTASAQPQTPSYFGWNGYLGNQSIYLTTDINSTNPYLIPASTTSGLAIQPSGNGNVKNVVDVSVGGYTRITDGNTIAYSEYYYGGLSNHMVIDIPVTAAGSSNWTEITTVSNEGGSSSTVFNGIDYEQFSLNVSASYPSAITTFETAYDAGINVSSTYDKPTNITQVGWNTMWYLLGLIPDGMGQVVSTIQYENSLYSAAGLASNPSYQYVGPGNDTQMKFGMDSGTTQTGSYSGLYSENWGYDTYGVTTAYHLTIMSKNFLNASKLIIGAQNIEQTNSNGVVTTNNGAYSNVSINVVPAYTIQGYTAVNGEKEGNQPLLLEDKTNGYNYYIKSNSTGFFRFFANPKDNYMLENTENSAGAIPIDPNGSTGGVTLNVNINTITFKTSSILDGNSWYVNINGPSGFSYTSSLTTGQTIEIETLGGGSYSYNIGVPNGWEANPANGQFNISNTHVIDIDFTPTSTYTVTFSSEGTNSGDLWAISVNGYTKQTTGTSISFSEPDGQFSWYVEDATVSTSYGSATYVWSGSPDSGTFSINGASPASISIKLTLDEVIENSNSGGGGGGGGTGCVNASTEILMANFTYMKASSILPGDYVLSYNLTTHQYQPEEIQTAYMSSHSTQYTINGILQTSPYQPILTKNGYVQAENLTTKMFIYNAFTGTFEKVHNITVSSGNFTMYDFQIPPDYDFIAWEYVVYDLTIKP